MELFARGRQASHILHPASLRERQQCGQLCPVGLLAVTAFGLTPDGNPTTALWSHKQQQL